MTSLHDKISETDASKNSQRIVGLAITAEKAKKHISPQLVKLAAESGIGVKIIDIDKPFEEQEPFDVLLHKVRSPEWHQKLEKYRETRSGLRVIDKLQSVMQLSNRVKMLKPMETDIVLTAPSEKPKHSTPKFIEAGARRWERINSVAERRQQILTVGAPHQIVIEEGMSPEAVREATGNAGLSPPFLGKSLWADGRSGSHGLTLIRDLEGLSQMITGPRPSVPSLPIILQQYTPHGGCLFKVYVMGPITVLVRRPSLQIPVPKADIEEEVGGIQSVGRISACFSNSQLGAAPQAEPPVWAIQALAQELRRRYNMDLFNFDLIQPELSEKAGDDGVHTDFLLLDVNAFPGYEKLPDYEELYVAYLKSLFSDDQTQVENLTRFVVSPRPEPELISPALT